MLKEKKRNVLNLIVESYLSSGKPVSSGYLVQKKLISDSPATIRNIMAELEELGFLYKPHPSAGRIPTDKGLRFYVNHLFEEILFRRCASYLSNEDFSFPKGSDYHALFNRVSRLLADYSDNLGFVISPRLSRINLHYLRFVKVAEDKVMIILITSFNLVFTQIIQTDAYFTQLELERAAQYIEQNFRGKNLLFVRNLLLQELPSFRLRYENLMSRLVSLLRSYFLQEERKSEIYLQGTSKFLEKAADFDLEKLKTLFHNFEEKAKLARLLSDLVSLESVKVLIGSELNLPEISDCSLILSHYGYNDQVLGSLGIIGPKRIPYKKIIPLVDSVAKKLSQTMSQNL